MTQDVSLRHLIGNRYVLQEKLGAGGMGAVYRAEDRLTRQTVALKRVTVPGKHLDFSSKGVPDYRLALAQEFRTLASLHHPNIISVLDYGFDEERQPYFTMDLLENSQPITKFGRELPAERQIELLVQVLQALAYLHRRGILHRDLKPDNVLVVDDGRVKVLDFGLAVAQEYAEVRQDTLVGTLAYLAPEVLYGNPASVASDLHVVGVIAYELFAGRYPFDRTDAHRLVASIIGAMPEMEGLGIDERLIPIIRRLLAKSPENRYSNALAVIRLFAEIAGEHLQIETAPIRESFLQAAKFVGREAEFERLAQVLAEALKGQGSAWLVGGESGVGKTRLFDELRTLALVEGALVVHGQGVSDGGSPYQLWREPVRRLVLTTELSDLEASILKEIVPDIGALAGRDIPEAPELTGKARQHRLVLTIVDLFKRQRHPVVLLVEDLQWTLESLEPLRRLLQIIADLPLLIVGNYRDDERPDLPDELGGMQHLKLERLTEEDIAELSVSMLGEAGRQPNVLDLLKRETEGNAFFLVEVVRALAEEAGQLSAIGRMALPKSVFAGGMRKIIRRRLGRVPKWGQPLLKFAAVAGRVLDLEILNHAMWATPGYQLLPGDQNLGAWLNACANAAVLEIHGGRWRFAHDKLRESLLGDLTDRERPVLHGQVAAAIETIYPGDNTKAARLVEHWYSAGNLDKNVHYALIMIEQYLAVSDYPDALALGERTLSLLPRRSKASATLLKFIGDAHEALSHFPQAHACYEESLAVARTLNDPLGIAAALNELGGGIWRHGDSAVDSAYGYFEQALAIAQEIGDQKTQARALIGLGVICWQQNNYDSAYGHITTCLEIYREINYQAGVAASLGILGMLAEDDATADDYYRQSLAISREIGDRATVSSMLNNLGFSAWEQDQTAVAQRYLQEALAINREIGDRISIAHNLNNLGMVAASQGEYAWSRVYHEEAIAIYRDVGHQRGLANTLSRYSHVQIYEGQLDAARRNLHETIRIMRDIDLLNDRIMVSALIGVARLHLLEDRPQQAAELLGVVVYHLPSVGWLNRIRVDPLRAELGSTLPAEELAAAIERGKQLDLATVVEELLAEFAENADAGKPPQR